MYRVFQDGTGHFIEIRDTDTPEGIANIIPITGLAPSPPDDFAYFKEGSNWITVDLIIAVTGGIFRYAKLEHPTGYFFTNILCSSPEEAQQRFNLPESNPANYKFRARIEPTRVIIGYMPDSTDVQMYVVDTSKVIFLGSTATVEPWGDITSDGSQL